MEIEDFGGLARITSDSELDSRLRSTRNGDYGAFILWHDRGGPRLQIHFFKQLAYLHYFPNGDYDHPGYQATGMSPAGCDDLVKFLQVSACEADAFFMSPAALVILPVAYQAAKEFLHDAGLPPSVSWFEL